MQISEFIATISQRLSSYRSASQAKGNCGYVSAWVLMAARLSGFAKENMRMAYAPVGGKIHYISVIDGIAVDFTYAQFDESAPWPLVTSDSEALFYYQNLSDHHTDLGYDAINVDEDFQMLQAIARENDLGMEMLHEIVNEGPMKGRALWSGNQKDHDEICG